MGTGFPTKPNISMCWLLHEFINLLVPHNLLFHFTSIECLCYHLSYSIKYNMQGPGSHHHTLHNSSHSSTLILTFSLPPPLNNGSTNDNLMFHHYHVPENKLLLLLLLPSPSFSFLINSLVNNSLLAANINT
jgi:hypothetical protein